MASAICPNCKIVLVEATDDSVANLGIAENEAVTLGANVVSNSYGGNEWTDIDHSYWHHGHIIVASSGDTGYSAVEPASYSTVVAVGGTHLTKGGGTRGWTETAWSSGGSGCSSFTIEPPWQLGQTICPTRMIADVAADADPSTGVAAYDTYPNAASPVGWGQYGGTSVSAPIVAAIVALGGNEATETYAQDVWLHGGSSALNDVTSGSDGVCPYVWYYICNARVGYDGPTGWGTPNGIAAFAPVATPAPATGVADTQYDVTSASDTPHGAASACKQCVTNLSESASYAVTGSFAVTYPSSSTTITFGPFTWQLDGFNYFAGAMPAKVATKTATVSCAFNYTGTYNPEGTGQPSVITVSYTNSSGCAGEAGGFVLTQDPVNNCDAVPAAGEASDRRVRPDHVVKPC